jgi:small-conductance mechanosensitive channel
MTVGRRHWARHAFACIGVGLSVWLGGLALAQQSPPPVPDTAAIPLVDLPGRAEEAEKLLKEAEARAMVPGEVQAIEARIPETAARLKEGLASIQGRLQTGLPLAQLELVTKEWGGVRADIAAELATLAKRAGQLDRDLDQIRGIRTEWERAREDARKGKAPRSLLDRIELILVRARTVQGEMESRRANLLILQGRVSQGQRLCDDLLDRLADAKRERVDELSVKDAPPVWSPRLWAGVWNELSSGAGGLVAGVGDALRTAFFRSDWRPTIHLVLLGVLLIVFVRVRRMALAWSAAERPASLSSVIFDRPVSSVLVLWLLLCPAIYSRESWAVPYLVGILTAVPVIRVGAYAAPTATKINPYIFAALFMTDRVRGLMAETPFLDQAIFLAEMATAALLAVWVFRASRASDRGAARANGTSRLGLATMFRLGFFVMGFAAVVGGLGYMDLARLVGMGALASCFAGLAISAGIHIATGLISCALHLWPLHHLASVARHRARLEGLAGQVLTWIGFIAWWLASFAAFNVLDGAVGLLRPILLTEWGWGAVRMSLGDLLLFTLVAWLSFLVSNGVRFLLEEDVFPRVQLAKGLPLALSRMARYAILFVGFSMALGVLGLDLTKVTILAGAVGVGIGFGLQTIVNNFISGLILLFERPIRVGDAIQIGEFQGEVRRIGIRASTVRTWEGADVIVPNSHLVSERVTNWTFSEPMRRMDVRVGVAYGTDPQRMIALLLQVAGEHAKVLRDPAPVALFLGFGESALNFELRAWTDWVGEWVLIRSELTVAVNAALVGAAIAIPLPQRDVRMRMVAEVPPGPAAGGAGTEG